MKKYRILSVILVLLLFLCCFAGCGIDSDKNKKTVSGGYANMVSELVDVKDAKATYEIVQNILDDGKSLDLSNMEITISKPLVLNNQNIYGGKIIYSGKDEQPVIKLSGKCIIDSVIFENTCKDVECGEGKYVGIWLSNDRGKVTNGTSISSCRFINCGTMVYAPADVEAAACGMTIENLRGENWTYRGIDIQSPNCENNNYYNLYLNTNFSPAGIKYEPQKASSDCAFFLNKSISATVKQLNVEHTSIKQPIVFNDCKDLVVTTIHIEGVSIEKDGCGYINFANTNGKIGAVDFYWTRAYCKDMGLVVLNESDKNGNEISIETFLVKGINDPSLSVAEYSEPRGMDQCDMKFFKRDSKYKNPYYVSIENYVYFTYQNDKQLLETFYSDNDNITFKKIGQIPAGGDTQSRPVNRLCSGYTKYYDTTLGKLLTWNGKDWE